MNNLVGTSDSSNICLEGAIVSSPYEFQILFDFSTPQFIEDVFVYYPFRSGVNLIAVDTKVDGAYETCGDIVQHGSGQVYLAPTCPTRVAS